MILWMLLHEGMPAASPWMHAHIDAFAGRMCVVCVCQVAGISSSRGLIVCGVDPSAWCAPGVNNRIYSLFINV